MEKAIAKYLDKYIQQLPTTAAVLVITATTYAVFGVAGPIVTWIVIPAAAYTYLQYQKKNHPEVHG